MTEDSKMEGSEIKVTGASQQNQEKMKKVGQSKFYDVSSCVVTSEKQDIMKPEDYLEEGKLLISNTYQIQKMNNTNDRLQI